MRGESDEADYVIVGAGSAGCVLAARLSAAGASVLLLEAGPADRYAMVKVPAGALKLRGHPVLDWRFVTEISSDAGERRFQWARGRVLGGSSSINGMNFVRGLPSDFDSWEAAGCAGWGFRDVLPHFKTMERYDNGSDAFRGRSGPLRVEDYRTILELTHRFVNAAVEAGFPRFPDLNAATDEGVGFSQMARNGRFRASSARAFLAPAMRRANLRVVTNAMVTGLAFDGRRCIGVQGRSNGSEVSWRARREVLLSAGAIGSPHLLQVSGVGDAAHLQSIGVSPKHVLPGVGRNLSDHYSTVVSQRVRGALTLNDINGSWRLLPAAIQWLTAGSGPFTFGATTATVYCRSRADLPHPDIQLLFMPGSFLPRVNGSRKELGQLEGQPGIRVSVSAARPRSRGTIRARSPDIDIHPSIDTGYLTERADVDTLLSGIRIARRIFSMPALRSNIVAETLPGPSVVTNEELETYARRTGNTSFHPCGTCKMGIDAEAVVDSRLRVRGIDRLRVIDASIMPSITSGNINAPATMIGEKGAAIVMEDAK